MNWVSFSVNAGNAYPEIWMDDITLKQYSRGYIEDTDENYCLDFFNMIADNNLTVNGSVTKETVFEISVKTVIRYTMGVTLSGSGKVTLAYDKEGKDVIRSIDCNGTATRYGVNFMTGELDKNVYIIFEPTGNGIAYNELYLFATKAVSFGYKMALANNPNNVATPTYTIEYVDAYAAIRDSLGDITDDDLLDDTDDLPDEEPDDFDVMADPDDSNSDNTSDEDSNNVWWIILIAVAAIALIAAGVFVLIILRKRKSNNI